MKFFSDLYVSNELRSAGTSGWLNYKLTLMVKSAKKYPKANEVLPARRSDGHGPWRIAPACDRDVTPHRHSIEYRRPHRGVPRGD